jgi:aryl-alcohol dehydrogenase-like predicted oxidoreductase
MKYTTLGNTGLVVSRLALGCMSYGDPKWRPWVLPLEEARPFFRRALEAGINLFDTADMYSLGVSEEITGRLLREMGRLDELVVATKVHFPMGPGPNRAGLSRKHVVQGCEASLKRLGVEAIDLYQVHRFDPATPLEETLEALDLLVRQGKVRYLGASSGEAWRFQKALGLSELRGLSRFVSMQNHYNLLYREEEREMLPSASRRASASSPGRRSRGGSSPGPARTRPTGRRRRAPPPTTTPASSTTTLRRRRDRGDPVGRGRAGRPDGPRGPRVAPLAPRRDGADRRRDEARAPRRGDRRSRPRALAGGNRRPRGPLPAPRRPRLRRPGSLRPLTRSAAYHPGCPRRRSS